MRRRDGRADEHRMPPGVREDQPKQVLQTTDALLGAAGLLHTTTNDLAQQTARSQNASPRRPR